MLEDLSDLVWAKYLSKTYLIEQYYNEEEITTLLLKIYLNEDK